MWVGSGLDNNHKCPLLLNFSSTAKLPLGIIHVAPDEREYPQILFSVLHKNICCGYSLEVSLYPEDMVLWRNKKNISFFFFFFCCKKCLIWTYGYDWRQISNNPLWRWGQGEVLTATRNLSLL